MTIISRHLLIASKDMQRYSAIPPPAGCSIARVPLDTYQMGAELTSYRMKSDTSEPVRVSAEITGFESVVEPSDIMSGKAEITEFTLIEDS